MAATVECGKLALVALPNIEVVTLLLALYSYVFGWMGIAAALVFIAIEPLIYGFGSWVISYFIYWPVLALLFAFLGRAKIKNRFLITLLAVLMTVLFGVLTSLVDVGLFSGAFDNFFYRFAAYYLRGIPFYLLQTGCNTALFFAVFPFLAKKLSQLKKRMN
jgi:hypothetical protein